MLREEPDWRGLSHAPMAVQRLIKRCLKKDPTARLHDIADAGLEIEDAVAESAPLVVQMPGVDPWRVSRKRAAVTAAAALATVAVLVALGIWLAGRPGTTVSESVSRVVVPVPAGQQVERGGLAPLAISPDGTRLVYVAVEREGRTRLFMRPLDRFEPTAIAGTEGGSAPFFSPDGRWVGFYANGALQRVSVDGGGALKICEAAAIWSATWGSDDTIVFATSATPGGLWRVPVSGATPERLTTVDAATGELQHAYPQRLPNGDVLFGVTTDRGWHLAVLSLDSRTGARARPARQRWRRRPVRAADGPSSLCECRRPRGRAVQPVAREHAGLAGATPRTPRSRPFGQRGVRRIRVGGARLHSSRVDVARARARPRGSHGTVNGAVGQAGRVHASSHLARRPPYRGRHRVGERLRHLDLRSGPRHGDAARDRRRQSLPHLGRQPADHVPVGPLRRRLALLAARGRERRARTADSIRE